VVVCQSVLDLTVVQTDKEWLKKEGRTVSTTKYSYVCVIPRYSSKSEVLKANFLSMEKLAQSFVRKIRSGFTRREVSRLSSD